MTRGHVPGLTSEGSAWPHQGQTFRLKEPENLIRDVITANLQVWGTEGKEKLVPLISNRASAAEDR